MSTIPLKDRVIIKIFNLARSIYTKRHNIPQLQVPQSCKDPDEVNQSIYNLLTSSDPCMIGRFGYYELECTVFYSNRKYHKYDFFNYIKCKSDIWWYPDSIKYRMQYNAGFFSPQTRYLDKFGEEMVASMPLVDILGSWKKEESYFLPNLKNAKFVDLELLNPLWGSGKSPWTMALEGKKVLVVHPFADTIKQQYTRRHIIHKDHRILPDFTLFTLKAVQSITGIKPSNFNTWFDALHYMEREIDKIDYDICLIGCGAYGFLLAAHCKKQGKKAVHLGGALQLLFGIRGKRWEDSSYGFNGTSYLSFVTTNWVRPAQDETPRLASDIEEGCYW